jgi:hypothetical protein
MAISRIVDIVLDFKTDRQVSDEIKEDEKGGA